MPIHTHTRSAVAALALLAAGATQAGIYTVTSTADSGPGSLRQIITDLPAGEANEIRFNAGGSGIVTFTVASPLPSLRGTSVLIDGQQPLAGTVIDGADTWRLFYAGIVPTTIRNITVQRGVGNSASGCIEAHRELTLENVTVRECRTGVSSSNSYGGGVSSSGTLTVRRSAFIANRSQSGTGNGDQSGGAIYHNGTLLIEESLFEDNVVALGPNLFSSGGAVTANLGPATIRRSRFIGNGVTGSPNGSAGGGGLRCGRASCTVESSYFGANTSSSGGAAIELQTGELVLRNVTVHGNTGMGAGAVRVLGSAGQPATLAIDSSTFSDNAVTAPNGRSVHLDMFLDTSLVRIANTVFGARASNHPGCSRWDMAPHYDGPGFNLATDDSCVPFIGSDSAIVGADALRLGNAVFGGYAEVLYMDAGSALVDAGNPAAVGSSPAACPATDANEVRRPRDGNGDGIARCDIGASELRGAVRGDIELDDPPPGRTVALTVGQPNRRLGHEVANVGDINGDGIDDMAVLGDVAIPGDTRGQAWIIYGRPAFAPSMDMVALDTWSGITIIGEVGRTLRSVAAAGDFDGDGIGDIVLGAEAVPGGAGSGAAYVVYGGQSLVAMSLDAPDGIRFSRFDYAASALPRLGSCVAAGGDVDGDGRDDVLIGASNVDTGSNESFAFAASPPLPGGSMPATFDLGAGTGLAGVLRLRAVAPDAIGDVCNGAGDVDGDGFDDLLLGTPRREAAGNTIGGAWLVFGRGAGTVDLANPGVGAARNFVGTGAATGSVVAGRHDFDDDGKPDVLIGTLARSGPNGLRNEAWLIGSGDASPLTLGPNLPDLLTVFEGDGAIGMLQQAHSMSDADGDGRSDLAVAAPHAADNDGEVLLNLSAQRNIAQWPPALHDPELEAQGAGGYRIIGRHGEQGELGSRIADGDFNGDGLADLLLGAPGEQRAWLVLASAQADMAAETDLLDVLGTPPTSIAGSVACRNRGTRTAVRSTCTVLSSAPVTVSCSPSQPTTLAPGAAIVCTVAGPVPVDGLQLEVAAFSGTQDPDITNNRALVDIGDDGDDSFANGFRDGFED